MKNKLIVLPLVSIALTSCSQSIKSIESKVFCFNSYAVSTLYEGKQSNLDHIDKLLNFYSGVTDNYLFSSPNGVYALNQTNEEVTVDERLYNLLKTSKEVTANGAAYFNPLCGSLSKKWKESLANKQILSETVINEELEKMNNSEIVLKENNVVQRTGEAEIDLGGIAKGYVLDEIKSYLDEHEITSYLINAGSSSILLGEKKNKSGLFNVRLKNTNNAYIQLKNCVVSTSSISEQGVTIGDVTYSHIINPVNGSAINVNQTVVVVSKDGYYGDAMSTSLMNNTVDEIKEIEKQYDIQTIVIKDKKVVYNHPDIEVKYK